MRNTLKNSFVRLVVCAVFLAIATLGIAQTYTYSSIGTLDGVTPAQPLDINDSRLVVGSGWNNTYSRAYAFAWDNGTLTQLTDLSGATNSAAWRVNNAGAIVGQSTVSGVYHATYWASKTATPIDLTPTWWGYTSSNFVAITQSGMVLAYAGSFQYFTYNPATGTTTMTPWSYTQFQAMNSSGEMVGSESNWTGTLTTPAGAYSFGTLGGRYLISRRINEQGVVAGRSDTSSGDTHSFLWRPYTPNGTTGKLLDLGTLHSGANSDVGSVNAYNWVVGYETCTGYNALGWLWREGQGIIDLNSIKPSSLTGTVGQGIAINTRGDIIVRVNYYSPSSTDYGVLLAS